MIKSLRKTLLFSFVIFFILSFPSLASTPKYKYTVDFNDTIINGQHKLGDIIFNREQYLSENYHVDNFTSVSFQNFDKFVWDGGGSIEVTRLADNYTEIVVPGGAYVFHKVGSYIYRSLGNGSLYGTIAVSVEDDLVISIETEGYPLDFELSENIFILGEDEKIVNFDVIVPDDLTPGSYNFEVFIISDYDNYSRDFDVELERNPLWNISQNNLTNMTAKSGVYDYMGSVEIVNNGNVDTEIITQITGNASKFINVQPKLNLYKDMFVVFNFYLQVPNKQPDGNFDADIIFRSEDKEEKFKFNLIIRDTTIPEILDVSFSDRYIYHINEVIVETDDNIGVERATINYWNKSYNMTKDQQNFIHEARFMNLTEYKFNICIFDSSDNKVCEIHNRTFDLLNIIDLRKSVVVPSKKLGKYSQVNIMNLTEESPEFVNITLVEFTCDVVNYTLGEDFKVRIEDGSGTVSMITSINQTINIKEKGQVLLEVLGEQLSVFDGIFEVDTPQQLINLSRVKFTGKVINYDLPEPIQMDWYGDEQLICGVVDTGIAETSYRDCNIKLPISVNLDDLPIPTTFSEKKKQDELFNVSLAGKDRKIDNRNSVISVLIGLLFALSITLYYGGRIYPYHRFRVKGRSR